MNRKISLLFVLTVMMSGWAFSHAKMTSTVPADGDFVGSLSEITLEFAAEVELTGAELKSVDGEDNPLEPFSPGPAKRFTIRVTNTLGPGEYYLVWRSIAADSHFSTGEFFFTVVAD